MGNTLFVLSAGFEFFYAAVSAILLVGCLIDRNRARPANRLMIAILITHTVMNAADACLWLWSDVPGYLALMKAANFLSYALGCVLFTLYACLLVCNIREYAAVPKWVTRFIFALGVLMALLWIISLFNGMYYYWDENGVYQVGRLYFLSQLFDVVFLLFGVGLVLAYRRSLPKRDRFVLILYSAIPLVSFAFVPLWDVVPVYTASTISLLLYYIAIQAEYGRRAAEQELELSNSRTAIMLSQIQPHFLYNSLEAVGYLCRVNPPLAEQTVTRFSLYLRGNMSSLTNRGTIPFEQELEHTKNYLYLEKARFEERLNVIYDIESTDFRLPPLTLQPIVENAVRYGVTGRENGGTVTIAARETPDAFVITVSDDGVGFDLSTPRDERAHIGVSNVRERIGALMKGTLEIKSEPDVGTTVTMTILKEA